MNRSIAKQFRTMSVLIVEPENDRVNRGASPAPPVSKAARARLGWSRKADLVVAGKAEAACPCARGADIDRYATHRSPLLTKLSVAGACERIPRRDNLVPCARYPTSI